MHKNGVWLSFIALLLLTTFWFCGKAGFQIYEYYSLSDHQTLEQVDWKIKELEKDSYGIYADYTFLSNGKEFKGSNYLSKTYPNYWAAQHVIKELIGKQWKVWYNPLNLEHTSLERNFPTKAFISACVLIGLLIYFIFLGYYVGRIPKTQG